ncbi:MAG: PEGA domain-containing protein [Deltaproteobacteria bacterium]|nr:PEGA domain-containing protein [Deltaproteobacteria bacterium]
MVSAVPYADVWIDGNKVGVTPYTSQQIKPGTHSVRLVNTALGKQKETYVNAQSGKTSNVSADFSQP